MRLRYVVMSVVVSGTVVGFFAVADAISSDSPEEAPPIACPSKTYMTGSNSDIESDPVKPGSESATPVTTMPLLAEGFRLPATTPNQVAANVKASFNHHEPQSVAAKMTYRVVQRSESAAMILGEADGEQQMIEATRLDDRSWKWAEAPLERGIDGRYSWGRGRSWSCG